MEAIDYSLIIPIYKNEAFVSQLLEAAQFLDKNLGKPFEIIFVIDGSPDRSCEKLKATFLGSGLNYTIINHSRNFGSFAAIRTGLKRSVGRFHAVMAADMQEPLSLIFEFFKCLAAAEADIVLGTRESRQDPWIKTLNAKMFWLMYRKFVNSDIPSSGVDVFGCTTEVKTKILGLNEANSSLIALLFWVGYRRQFISYKRAARREGKGAWTFRKNLKYLGDSVFGFTDLPIRVLFMVGFLGLLISLGLGGLALFGKLTGTIGLPGYATNVVALGLFWATNMFSLGVIGAYIWRTYENTKFRPESISYENVVVGRSFHEKIKSELAVYTDSRGTLTFGELNRNLPFIVKRYFLIQNVPNGQIRGNHAHRECSQFITCTSGNVRVKVETALGKQTFDLSKSSEALNLPPLSWCVLENFSVDAVILVLASHTYSKEDYIHSYSEFRDLIARGTSAKEMI